MSPKSPVTESQTNTLTDPAETGLSEDFQQFYREFWGERWPQLLRALRGPDMQVARKNRFADIVPAARPWRPDEGQLYSVEDRSLVDALRGSEGLLAYYVMDPASVYVARCVDVRPHDQVLDMCAAPGGKSLVLIEALAEGQGQILLNEVSMPRRERLKKVVQQYVDREVRARVRLTGKDGGKFALSHPEYFDRILVDAPCSGEKHLLENATELAQWNRKRSKGLAQRQYALLTGALEALKPGGRLVYSTCSVSKLENEQVVERFLAKKSDRIELDPVDVGAFGGENVNGMGYFLPDHCGFGPLFVACFRKREA